MVGCGIARYTLNNSSCRTKRSSVLNNTGVGPERWSASEYPEFI